MKWDSEPVNYETQFTDLIKFVLLYLIFRPLAFIECLACLKFWGHCDISSCVGLIEIGSESQTQTFDYEPSSFTTLFFLIDSINIIWTMGKTILSVNAHLSQNRFLYYCTPEGCFRRYADLIFFQSSVLLIHLHLRRMKFQYLWIHQVHCWCWCSSARGHIRGLTMFLVLLLSSKISYNQVLPLETSAAVQQRQNKLIECFPSFFLCVSVFLQLHLHQTENVHTKLV